MTDNGKGFETPRSPVEFAPEGHFGLLGMQERAELIEAQFQIPSIKLPPVIPEFDRQARV